MSHMLASKDCTIQFHYFRLDHEKTCPDMPTHVYFIQLTSEVTGDVIAEPAFNRVANGDSLDLKLKLRGS